MKNNILQIAKEGVDRIFYIIPDKPAIAQIEITNRCNFSCLMCQRVPLKVPLKDMNIEVYKRIIDRLDQINEVILTGWGEPLIHPGIFEMIKYAKNKGKKVGITSNGSLLTKKYRKMLVDTNIDTVSFSVDEVIGTKNTNYGHKINTQLKNIQAFISDKNSDTKVIIQTTLHKKTSDKIKNVVKWAAGVGANSVNINRLDLRFNKNLKRPSVKEEKDFSFKLDSWQLLYGITTEFRQYVAFRGFVRLGYRLLSPLLQRGGRHCLRNYNYIYINMIGDITPCCALPLWSVGNIFDKCLKDIWNDKKFIKFRDNHKFQREICGQCDVLERKQYA